MKAAREEQVHNFRASLSRPTAGTAVIDDEVFKALLWRHHPGLAGVLHAHEWRQKDRINDEKPYRILTLTVARFHIVVEWLNSST